MTLLLRAIITGFGYKLGAELGKRVAEKIGLSKREESGAEETLPEGLPKTPPGGEQDDGDEAPPDEETGDDEVTDDPASSDAA